MSGKESKSKDASFTTWDLVKAVWYLAGFSKERTQYFVLMGVLFINF